MKKYDLDPRTESDIIRLAKKRHIKRVILFGSRARGDNKERSDIDLAVNGGSASDYYFDHEESAHTLLFFDVVDLDRHVSEELKKEIDKDGVILYEEV